MAETNGGPTAHDAGPSSSSSSSVPFSPEQQQQQQNGTPPTRTSFDTPDPSQRHSSEHDHESESDKERTERLEHELAVTRQEKDRLGEQYRSLLGKLTGMRQSLGEKLREDAEELDRREAQITSLQSENASLSSELANIKSELLSASQEAASLSAQLAQLRSQSDSSSSDVLGLTREMRELRREMERLRVEREEWEGECVRERGKREAMEEEVRAIERREREGRREFDRGQRELEEERLRAMNLQEVLGEFQAAKDSELRQATRELEQQLCAAATSLSEYKLRAANAETRLGEVQNDAGRSAALERELREKNQIIGRLRHDAVINNEHLTEALRRLRNSSSDTNVDRRLVTNILISFLTTQRADPKRFEMLSLLSTILSWDDAEREKAGLQRIGATGIKSPRDKGKGKGKGEKGGAGGRAEERSAEEEAAMNESFSNLFVEFLLKEASQGQPTGTSATRPHLPHLASSSSHHSSSDLSMSSPTIPPPMSLPSFSPPSGHSTPYYSSQQYQHQHQPRPRGLSNSSNVSSSTAYTTGEGRLPRVERKGSFGLKEAMGGGAR